MKNTQSFLLTAIGVMVLSCAPAVFAQDHHDEGQDRGAQSGDRARDYHFRDEDAPKLRQHYKNVERVDVSHRTALVAGAHLTGDWHRRLRPVPVAVVRELPPPPPGYVFGYLDGYCVVYDPTTLLIADVIDLANLAR
jgi:Ni/Co efflux regulator RcnB